MPELKDKYPNILFDSVTESGTNTLTFEEISMGLNIFDKVGLIISRIEWYGFHAQMQAVGDNLRFGLSASNGWTTTTPGESSIITYHHLVISDYGTAGNNKIWQMPLVDDFSDLPGGGLLVTPKPFFLFAEGANLPAPATIDMRLFFTVIKLKPEDYFELLEARQFFS